LEECHQNAKYFWTGWLLAELYVAKRNEQQYQNTKSEVVVNIRWATFAQS